MAHHIAFNPDSVHLAMKNLLLEMESGGAGSLTNMQTNVQQFTVDGSNRSFGSIDSLRGLTDHLKTSLTKRSEDARLLYDELSEALTALELIISDLNAREDDQSLKSAQMLENVQDVVESRITPTTPASTGDRGSGPSAEDIKSGGFSGSSGEASP